MKENSRAIERIIKGILSQDSIERMAVVNEIKQDNSVIKEFDELFSQELNDKMKCNIVKHRINTADNLPSAQRNFQIPKLWEKEIDAEVTKLLKAGIIRTSVSPWASRIIPVRKKNGDLRMCIDYRHLKSVFESLKEAGIMLNKAKSKFFQKEINILGVQIKEGIMKPDVEKVKAINEYKKPKNVKELRSFLGLANYCRGFIPDLAKMEVPLNKLLKGETKRSVKIIEWDEEKNNAFLQIRKCLNNETLRVQPNFDKEFILTTDASDFAIGTILSQKDDKGNEKMICAFSKTLDKAQRNYGITDKELLAIVKSTEHFRRYLLGREFLLKTDHKALTYPLIEV